MRTPRPVQGAGHRRDDRLDQRAGRAQRDQPRPGERATTRWACCSSTRTTSPGCRAADVTRLLERAAATRAAPPADGRRVPVHRRQRRPLRPGAARAPACRSVPTGCSRALEALEVVGVSPPRRRPCGADGGDDRPPRAAGDLRCGVRRLLARPEAARADDVPGAAEGPAAGATRDEAQRAHRLAEALAPPRRRAAGRSRRRRRRRAESTSRPTLTWSDRERLQHGRLRDDDGGGVRARQAPRRGAAAAAARRCGGAATRPSGRGPDRPAPDACWRWRASRRRCCRASASRAPSCRRWSCCSTSPARWSATPACSCTSRTACRGATSGAHAGLRHPPHQHHPGLRHRDPDVALARADAQVQDWRGGTRIASSLAEFNRQWARRLLAGNAAMLLVTDGLDRDEHGELSRGRAAAAPASRTRSSGSIPCCASKASSRAPPASARSCRMSTVSCRCTTWPASPTSRSRCAAGAVPR